MEQNEIRLEAQDCNQQGAILLKAGNIEAASFSCRHGTLSSLLETARKQHKKEKQKTKKYK